MKIDVGDGCRYVASVLIVAIAVLANDHVFEAHVVPGERACFIWEDMLYLSKLFIEGACLYFHFWGLGCSELAITDIDALQVLDHLKGDDERDGNEVGEKHDPAAPIDEERFSIRND